MMSLWNHALESNKAVLLDEIDLGPDALLRKVEEFEAISQATEHSYPALVMSSEDGSSNSISTFEDDSQSEFFSEDDVFSDDEYYDSESFEEVETSAPPGSLPIDLIAEKLDKK
ncbi:CRS2-ASSOCIATED FACTOR 1 CHLOROPLASTIC [Salix purpurea]|uniref:CRS2-ASSOCIATED FACTOR 1 CHLOROPLASTIC n=1 Tax=Salix purpurea TaxID=77065 RepID=A0A9Q0Z350_SALPP|nr:CRS2-ASSOCIATED FACTOR 1 CHLOROPLASTIC [Salix purpurea]